MAFALVNNTAVNFETDNYNPAMVATVPETTVGNLLVAIAWGGGNAKAISTVEGGATYSQIHALSDTASFIEVWAGICTSAVTTVTVTLTSNTDTFTDGLVVLEFSGPLSPLAESGISVDATLASTTTHATDAITPDTTETLFLTICRLGGSPGTWTRDAQFTGIYDPATANSQTDVSYKAQTGAGAETYSSTSTTARASKLVSLAIRGALAASPVTVVPPVGTAALTGLAPILSLLNTLFAPPVGSLSITGLAPTLSIEATSVTIVVPVGSMLFTGTDMVVSIETYHDTTEVIFTGLAPILSFGTVIYPGCGGSTFTGLSPGLSAPTTKVMPVGGATLSGLAPTLAESRIAVAGSAAFTGIAPRALLGIVIVPPVGSARFSGAVEIVHVAGGGLTRMLLWVGA